MWVCQKFTIFQFFQCISYFHFLLFVCLPNVFTLKVLLANAISVLTNTATADSASHLPVIFLMDILLDSTDTVFRTICIKKKWAICSSFLIRRGPWHAWYPSACLFKGEILGCGEITKIQSLEGMVFRPARQASALLRFQLHPSFPASEQRNLTALRKFSLVWLQALLPVRSHPSPV